MIFKKLLQSTKIALWCLFSFAFFVYSGNTALITLSAPGNSQIGSQAMDVKKIGDMSILAYDDLKSGGIGVFGWNVEASGYVNMLSSENAIYVNSEHVPEFTQGHYLYKHEYAHVLQKEMVAHHSGGYPEIYDPVQSLKYYYNLFKLNKELREVMPKISHDTAAWFMTDGLEAASECYAQPHSSKSEPTVYYDAPYLEDGHCTAEQSRLAISLVNTDEWFNPVLPIDKLNKVKEENITSIKPVTN